MGERYDLVVIGAGPAGEKGAAQAAYFGKRVAVVDRLPHPGGAPVASTGIPSKTLRETALYVTGFRNRDVYGLSLNLDRGVVLQRLMSRKSEVASTMARAVEENLKRHGIRYIQGEARLVPGQTVRVAVDGRELSLETEILLIASGFPATAAGLDPLRRSRRPRLRGGPGDRPDPRKHRGGGWRPGRVRVRLDVHRPWGGGDPARRRGPDRAVHG